MSGLFGFPLGNKAENRRRLLDAATGHRPGSNDEGLAFAVAVMFGNRLDNVAAAVGLTPHEVRVAMDEFRP